MLGSAIGCGILLGVFEGVGVLVGRCVSLALLDARGSSR